jgi:hypothetical protein
MALPDTVSGQDLVDAYRKMYGVAPANAQSLIDNAGQMGLQGASIKDPAGNNIPLSTLFQNQGGGTAAPATAPTYNAFGQQAPTISSGATGGAAGSALNLQPGQLPEQAALAQIAQIDPQTEALRQQLAGSYLTPLAQAGAPTADQFQSYLNLYGGIDPTGLAGRQALGQQLTSAVQLGSQLDPVTQRQVEQATRLAQQARGNVYGTPQLTEEAMTTGEAGLQLQQQRQQALQSYLGSGQTTGDVALNLYNQAQNQLRAQQGASLGYLTSGATPYQTGSSYLQLANQNAAQAAQGGPQYNPSSLGQSYSGTSQQFPQYGLDIGAQSQNLMGAMNYGQSMQGQQGNQTGSLISGIGSGVSSLLGSLGKAGAAAA